MVPPHVAVESRANRTRVREEQYIGFALCDPLENRIGRVEKVFANPRGEPRYIRVQMGLFGLKSVLLPVKEVAVNEKRRMPVIK